MSTLAKLSSAESVQIDENTISHVLTLVRVSVSFACLLVTFWFLSHILHSHLWKRYRYLLWLATVLFFLCLSDPVIIMMTDRIVYSQDCQILCLAWSFHPICAGFRRSQGATATSFGRPSHRRHLGCEKPIRSQIESRDWDINLQTAHEATIFRSEIDAQGRIQQCLQDPIIIAEFVSHAETSQPSARPDTPSACPSESDMHDSSILGTRTQTDMR